MVSIENTVSVSPSLYGLELIHRKILFANAAFVLVILEQICIFVNAQIT